MLISPINAAGRQNSGNIGFGHTFKVSICLKKTDGKGYDFVNPYSDRKLYKQLNSKVVGYLNENFLTNLRTILNRPLKKHKTKDFSTLWNRTFLVRKLYTIDSDYRQLNLVRSVYDGCGLGYIATGVDVPIIENIKGAKKIGIAKASSVSGGGKPHNPYVSELIKNFRNTALSYVKDKQQLLLSKNGKEIMLRINFKTAGKDKKGNTIYELDDSDFYEIKKSVPVSQREMEAVERIKSGNYPETVRTIQHYISKITGGETFVDTDKILNQPLPKHKIVPKQLELEFKD